MRPPHRVTRSTNSPPSPNSDSRPKPTLADIPLAPRRRLRDGRSSTASSSTSSRGRASISRSVRRGSSVSSAGSSRSATSSMSVVGRNGLARRNHIMSALPSVLNNNENEDENETQEGIRSISSSRASSLTPPPPLAPIRHRSIEPQQRQRQQRQPSRSIIDILDEQSYEQQLSNGSSRSTPIDDSITSIPNPNSRSRQSSETSSLTSAGSEPSNQHLSDGRRYTAEEKGKGRAMITPIEIESSPEEEGDDSIQILNVPQKRRRGSVDDSITENVVTGQGDDIDVEEEDTLGGGYTCPVCFCAPSQAVMTFCGHILCAQCLHSSLLSAISRNPAPYPDAHPHRGGRFGGTRGNGRGGRGRSTRNSSNSNSYSTNILSMYGPGPNSWTKELLQEFYHRYLNKTCEDQLKESDISQANWDAIKELQLPKVDDIKVEQKLKGLWRVENSWVVEGECPVCRNPIPGGYGPPGTGIGGVIPLQARLSGFKNGSKKRR
ncbi:uncharacterized protein IL334_002277 [Kwoniella shivajii]|uniref:RING-type domain-containing protein n=1 Tax=Kwoniella shivajii TaxID=564305 RepID=A0ABZ1CUA1_9TREE|nr:hypothetical protein IL334_002277 [Kwoniella shivajii]